MRSALSRSRSCRLNFGGEDESDRATASSAEPILFQRRLPTRGSLRSASTQPRSCRRLSFQEKEEPDATEAISKEFTAPVLIAVSPSVTPTAMASDAAPDNNELKASCSSKAEYYSKMATALCLSLLSMLQSMVMAFCQHWVVRVVAGQSLDLLIYVAGTALMCAGWLLTIMADAIRVSSLWLINRQVVRDALIAVYGGGGGPSNKKQE
jgi:hypothetical protein